jgi:hypothetical protein
MLSVAPSELQNPKNKIKIGVGLHAARVATKFKHEIHTRTHTHTHKYTHCDTHIETHTNERALTH